MYDLFLSHFGGKCSQLEGKKLPPGKYNSSKGVCAHKIGNSYSSYSEIHLSQIKHQKVGCIEFSY